MFWLHRLNPANKFKEYFALSPESQDERPCAICSR
jgi:hypothetical protein